ncbi:Threonine/homoserine/homoserine lactone efflux protein [Andreprevotia lacus DSM 23236]|jgi:threonine/homoserine/homoserine lactone efflux protein|uniref:Threonine/homoserine/homoserine lactone efflux protein n=1 Tax=Andreprevotia lacus DSM 23236 TaxID=1121001 RepID=A0A1W1XYB6_9NEIS|nr:LysE family translocator [Andreprevotia lacus]SMC28551.1 Threonine/homoserine/homoserine lactone efflux protein [Andreprevotia lacus DSM 23236]
MKLEIWLAFIAVTLFISATPGPNMLLMLSHGTRYGWRATLATMAGALCGLALLFTLSAFGLAAILAASATLFLILKLVGAAYLVYLGVQCWRAGESLSLPQAKSDTAWSRYRTGLTVALSNPKAILFAGAFLPQFISPSLPQGQQWLVLLSTFFVIEGMWQVAYAAGGHQLANWLRHPGRIRIFNRSCGSAFFAVGGALALARR